MGVAKMTRPYQIIKNSNLVTKRANASRSREKHFSTHAICGPLLNYVRINVLCSLSESSNTVVTGWNDSPEEITPVIPS